MFYQTLLNTALAAAGLAVAAPLMAITALAVRFSSSGGVLSRHVRVGLNGVPFTRYKFRSMSAEAEAASGGSWASGDDARLTRVGRIIRRFRLDELPQLFNVVRGEMSLVGPRPERPEFVEALSAHLAYYRQRHYVRPGITGWSQIQYQGSGGPEDSVRKLEYDLYYVKNMSVSLDIFILFHTIKFIVFSRGAQ
jgi:lipopolysaccharide/colanic/teichoic acid biosynthesis glycosyltransferase